MDWSAYYPAFVASKDGVVDIEPQDGDASTGEKVRPLTKEVEVADIGCGFGGLLVALAPRLPDTLLLGTAHDTPVKFSASGILC